MKPKEILSIILVEDNEKLNNALKKGLEATEKIIVKYNCNSGSAALEFCKNNEIDAILMDVQIVGANGIESAIAIRNEFPRKPVVIYSIQDDDSYYRAFRNSGILSHYAYVKKSNYLLPSMVLPLLRDAYLGRNFIDPEIESRVEEVKHKDANSPLSALEPNELKVAKYLAKGFSNEQIAIAIGIKDKRTVSRINGQIYSVWGLDENSTDEKVARIRATLIVRENKWLTWKENGSAFFLDEKGNEVEWK